MACGKRKSGVIRGERDGLSREEDLEQCREAGAGLGACVQWAGPRPDNRLCAAVEGSRKLVTVTHGNRGCSAAVHGAQSVCIRVAMSNPGSEVGGGDAVLPGKPRQPVD